MSSIPPDFNKNGFPPGEMGGYALGEFASHQQYGQYYGNNQYPVMNTNNHEYTHQTATNHSYHTYFPSEMHHISMNYGYQNQYMHHATAPKAMEPQANLNDHANGGQNGIKPSEPPKSFPCVEEAFNQLTSPAPPTPVVPPAIENLKIHSDVPKSVSDHDLLTNSTSSDSESTESNSPHLKDEPILSPIGKQEELKSLEQLTPAEPKMTKEEWIKASQLECSFSEVLSLSFVAPITAPETREVGTETNVEIENKVGDDVVNENGAKSDAKPRRRLIESDDEDTRAEEFWNNPELESIPSSLTKERKKKTSKQLDPKASINDKEKPSDDSTQGNSQLPSTSATGPLLSYGHSVDVNLDVSDAELANQSYTAEIKTDRRKRKNRNALTMSYTKKKKPNHKEKPVSKTSAEKSARLDAKKKKFRAASLEFKFEADLEYALEAFGDKYPAESIKEIRKYLDRKKRSRKNPHYLRTNIDFEAVYPDAQDYRHCDEYRKKMTSKSMIAANTRRRSQIAPTSAPVQSLFGTLYVDLNSSANDVLESAKNWFTKSSNDVYKKSDVFVGPVPDENLAELERKFYENTYGDKQLEHFSGVDRNRIQTPVLTVKTAEDLENPNLKRILNSASITVVSGICKAAGIDKSLFNINTLCQLNKELTIDCLLQNPQSADHNLDTEGNKTWSTSAVRTARPFPWFVKYMEKRHETCEKYLKKMVAGVKKLEATENSIIKGIVQEQEDFEDLDKQEEQEGEAEEKVLEEKPDPSMYWTCFGTNIDLQSRETFPEQHQHLDKLPEFLRPTFNGNLLNLIGEDVLGVNTVQVYSKPPGARTAAHMENSLMASININLGPGKCVWFAVPYEYWGRIATMVEDRGLQYHRQNYWPNEDELRAEGIPVQKFTQNEDELVYVNTGCFHWVQSSGYCVNVSWNVGQPTGVQMSTALIAATHNAKKKYETHIPICKIAWRIAKEKLFMSDDMMYETVRSILIRTFAHTTWYEEELAIKKKLILSKDKLEFPLPSVFRCIQCQMEVFNVVRWFLGNESTAFCHTCNPRPEHTAGRYEAYTVICPREELMEIMDGYKRRSLEEGALEQI